VVEHDLNFVMDICHRVVVLDRGRRIASGTPAEVQSQQHVVDAYLGD
jgi:ABC-type branched-subunit amino acid transport system ATPase component